MTERTTFTGRGRRRSTRWQVRAVDRVAQALITFGGVGTIVAVSLVGLFLAWVVLPLFYAPEIDPDETLSPAWASQQAVRFEVDEHRVLGTVLSPRGVLRTFRIDTGATIHERELFPGEEPTAYAPVSDAPEVVFGFADGTVRQVRIEFRSRFPDVAGLPEAARALAPEAFMPLGDEILELTPQGQYRLHGVTIETREPFEIANGPVRGLAHTIGAGNPVLAALSADGAIRLAYFRPRIDPETGERRAMHDRTVDLPPPIDAASPPDHLLLDARGDSLFLLWENGRLDRYATGNPRGVALAETVSLVEDDSGARLTAARLLLGGRTLIVGDSRGRTSGWFLARPEAGDSPPAADGRKLVRAHDYPAGSAAVTSLGMSAARRMFAAGHADGTVSLFQATTEERLLTTTADEGKPVTSLAIAPEDDGLFALTGGGFWRASIDPRHPEATLAALFLPVWYEGDAAPSHVWQSTGGSQDFEPKFGLAPLVFGTLKATFYTLLFGAPLAFLAALHTSEFVHPRVRARIKPGIEVMASLPSVVLGFMAIVIAPFVGEWIPAILALLVTAPIVLMLAAHVWQVLPQRLTLRLEKWRLVFVLLALPIAAVAAWGPGPVARLAGIDPQTTPALRSVANWGLGPFIERTLFAGDVMQWLNGTIGNPLGGWLLLLLPVAALAVAWSSGMWVRPAIVRRGTRLSRAQFALLDVGRFFVTCGAALGLALAGAGILTLLGFDPRGPLVGTYQPMNALIVGFVMGFAIIPIIYTIADDALSAVPDHLRAASLGAGATPWQTAVRIVIPTAMSGLFSALMVGLGRAVGETMIVLMAGGNTPIMDLNPFNGFRPLSGNIAFELPEAVKDSTHYRVLFLAGLTLFAMTFVVNTVAEMVRIRFRRRVHNL
ncbi:MAG: ABC transporter permease subunit [Planctomycetaceae bacterium]